MLKSHIQFQQKSQLKSSLNVCIAAADGYDVALEMSLVDVPIRVIQLANTRPGSEDSAGPEPTGEVSRTFGRGTQWRVGPVAATDHCERWEDPVIPEPCGTPVNESRSSMVAWKTGWPFSVCSVLH